LEQKPRVPGKVLVDCGKTELQCSHGECNRLGKSQWGGGPERDHRVSRGKKRRSGTELDTSWTFGGGGGGGRGDGATRGLLFNLGWASGRPGERKKYIICFGRVTNLGNR